MQLKLLPFRTAIALSTAISILSPVTVIAGDEDKAIDMSQLTCGEFLDLGRKEKMMSLVWYSGWSAETKGDFIFTPDRGAMSERKDSLEGACENSQDDLVVNQLQIWTN